MCGPGHTWIRASAAPNYVRHGDERVLDRTSDRTLDLLIAAGDDTDLRAGLARLAVAGFDAVSFAGRLGPDTRAGFGDFGP